MKFDLQKAFPYPVLRPQSDDYRGVEFQATVDLAIGGENIEMGITYDLSSTEIANEIDGGKAEYVCIISCRDTYFRAVVSGSAATRTTRLATSDLRGEVSVCPFVVVTRPIPAFSSRDINPEFGKGPFSLTPGDILAQDEPQVFFIDRELFKPITSLFDLVKKEDLDDGEWTIGFEEDHVQIEVSPAMKDRIDDARNTLDNKIILLNSIYFAAVMQTVAKLQQSANEFEGKKWAQVIGMQAHNKGCDLESMDAYLIAQRLMRHPLLRLRTLFSKGAD